MAYDESSDILGGRLHVSPPRSSAWSDPGQITLLLGLGLAALYAWIRVAPHYRQWRETRYRKAMRRRHGIPDDDNRPFNVAYAAALQARKGNDGRGRTALEGEVPVSSHDGEDERLAGAVPQRPPPPSYVSGGYSNIYPVLDRDHAVSHSYPDSSVQAIPPPTSPPAEAGPFERKSRANGAKGPLITRSSHGKHALDEERDSEPETQAKKTRLEGEELIHGDKDAGWHGPSEDMDVDEVQPAKRGSKRVASSEDDEGLASSRADRLDKRARKVSIDRSPQSVDDDMEENEEDTQHVVRGKKRDRTEADSTFGGDDSVLDDDEKPQRRRRRRNVSNKFVHDSSRGQKRGRDSHSHDSDDSDSEVPRRQTTRKKRGRRSQDGVIPLSNDPLCKGRRIGEEWESNGIRFKVGPNGQRLRQELVKKSRSRFPMPSDSYHPDRRAHVDVYVEMWLSEEEYQSAKERHELAWQDAPPTPPEPQTPGDVPDSPSKAGKSLLWSSTMASRESPTKRGPFRQSVVTNVGLRLNVFPPAPVPSTRRITSVYQAPSSPATDSPKLQKSKSYSKWEKQDLEAAAMSKIRARQQAAGAEANKTLPSASSTASPLNTIPASAASKAPENSAAPGAPSFSFAPSATSTASSKPAAPDVPKFNVPATTPAPTASSTEPTKAAAPSFTFAPSSGATPTATASAASAPSAPQAGSTVPNFFSKPATQTPTPSAAPSTTPSTSVPNFFAPKAPAPASSATSGNATQGQGNETSKPTFSFGATTSQPAGSAPSPFGNATNASDTAKTDQAKAAPGTSLLSRLGMGPPPSQPTSTSTPTFSFTKPDAASASTPASGSDASKAAPAAASAGPKFSFGVTSKPSTATPSSTPAANGAAASSTPATSTPTFGFGTGNSGSQPAASNTSNPFGAPANKDGSASSAPKSAFAFGGGAPTSNAFGGSAPANNAFGGASSGPAAPATSSPFGGASNNAAKPGEAAKSAFAFGGSTPATNASPFGAAPSPFGAPGSLSGDPLKPGEAQKSAFSFGAGAGNMTSSSSTPSFFGGGANTAQKTDGKTDGQTSKPTFSFGGSSSTPAFGSSSTSSVVLQRSVRRPSRLRLHAFGATSTPSTSAFGASTTPGSTPAFGSSSTPTSAFGSSSTPAFGATTTPGAPAGGSKPTFSFGFGSTNNSGASSSTPAAANTTENKPASKFNFGAPSNNASPPAASGFGSQPANGSAPSPFGTPSSTTSGSGAFSFGASSGAFSFVLNPIHSFTMLSSSTNSTGTPRRPKPPAKARKSTSLNFASFAPPPPYPGPLEEVLLDSPVPVTAQLINAAASKAEGIGLPGTPGVEDWINEKSREELSGLLLKADGIIKSRETELSLTSALCKSLYTDNVTLKSKHESLLARLPGTRTSTPSSSRPTSPFRLDAPSLERSPSYSVAFPGSPTEPNQSLAIPARLRRIRRVSVTPGELSMLADQNAELIDKLEKLEDESEKADQTGKRKLRKLEEEIQVLREELERTQARGQELEEQAKAATQAIAVQKRKEEREARLQALKERSAADPPTSDAPDEEVRDFAPPSWLPSRSSPMKRSASASTSASTHSLSSDHAYERALGITPMEEEPSTDEEHESYFPNHEALSSNRDQPPQAEFAIVSQLLAKIGELERTNAEIKEQQRLTDERRRAAQWDAESIRRVYDWLDDDDVDLEIHEETAETRGLQRLMSSESDIFADEIPTEMQSTMRDGLLRGNAAPKARRTVVGLFDQDPDNSIDSPPWGQYPSALRHPADTSGRSTRGPDIGQRARE
ncbi:hypothetical protein C8T65DRAFT_729190 [Cerioporus squamosus]|nr:hypothetical protein C8T65DRAFT_729190 [Cerioporus squamosus]